MNERTKARKNKGEKSKKRRKQRRERCKREERRKKGRKATMKEGKGDGRRLIDYVNDSVDDRRRKMNWKRLKK